MNYFLRQVVSNIAAIKISYTDYVNFDISWETHSVIRIS